MNIQFHLTNSCNLRCKHCYQGAYNPEHISLEQFNLVMRKTCDFFASIGDPVYTLLLTGGEPLCVPAFEDYLFSANQFCEKLSIMSNGTLLTEENLLRFKQADKFFRVQVSLEGPEPINDSIRGIGTFKKIRRAIRLIKDAGLRCTVSCTLAPYNYDKVDVLYADLISHDSPDVLWFDRCIPFKGTGLLTKEQFAEFIHILSILRRRYLSEHLPVIPSAGRALQWLSEPDKSHGYCCAAGLGHFTIMHNGDVMICRRLDFAVGNLLKEEWSDIMERAVPIMEKIHSLPDDCADCQYAHFCNGGLKCLTYSQFHDFNRKDVNCLC